MCSSDLGDVNPIFRDAAVNVQKLIAHLLAPNDIMIVGNEDAAARCKVVPGKNEASRFNPHFLGDAQRQLAGGAVDVRRVENEIRL